MITWNTVSGVLGSVYNFQSYNFYLNATSNVTSSITYSVSSGSLPDGANLESNGYIYGTALAAEVYTSNAFTISADDGVSNANTFLTINRIPFQDQVTWISPSNNLIQTVINNSSNVNISLVASSRRGQAISYTSNSLPNGVRIIGNNLTGLITGNTNLINNTSVITASTFNQNVKSNVYINWNFKPYSIVTYTATISSNVQTVDEGKTVLFTVNSSDIPSGSPLIWTGIVTDSYLGRNIDRTSLQLVSSTGLFSLTGGTGTFEITIADNELNEDNIDSLTVVVKTNDGFFISSSNSIPINNTSNNCGQICSYQVEFGTAGTYTWYPPNGVSKVHVVAVGGGGGGGAACTLGTICYSSGGGGGGNLAWKNNIPVSHGTGYTVQVGAGGPGGQGGGGVCGAGCGSCSFFLSNTCVMAWGGAFGSYADWPPTGPSGVRSGSPCAVFGCGDGGGIGGTGGGLSGSTATPLGVAGGSGGGAGGYGNVLYPGRGGNGVNNAAGNPGQLGGGGSGASFRQSGGFYHGYGGSVGLKGCGPNGAGATYPSHNPGSPGSIGPPYYGGGGAGGTYFQPGLAGVGGGVRIIWDGNNPRCFPCNAFDCYFCWSNTTSTLRINSGVGLNVLINALSNSNITYSIDSGCFPAFANLNPANGLISGTGYLTSAETYKFKVRATSGEGNIIVLPYNIVVGSGRFNYKSPTPANNSVRALYIGKSNVEIPLNAENSFNSNIFFMSNTLPDGMVIKNNLSGGSSYIVGTPTGGTSNTLTGNVSIISAVLSVDTNIRQNLYVNWNLYAPQEEVYFLKANTNLVKEGDSVMFTIDTFNVSNGNILYWNAYSTEGNLYSPNITQFKANQANQFLNSNGFVAINNSQANVIVNIINDLVPAYYYDQLLFTVSKQNKDLAPAAPVIAATWIKISDSGPPVGQITFSTAGTYNFIVPENVYSVSVVTVGGGGGGNRSAGRGGGGGGLGYRNCIPACPLQVFTVVVGGGGGGGNPGGAGGPSCFANVSNVFAAGNGGSGFTGNGFVGDGGGCGGLGGCGIGGYMGGGGGGAGGYGGNGGAGGLVYWFPVSPQQAWRGLDGSPGTCGAGGGGAGGTGGSGPSPPGCRFSGGGGNVSLCGIITRHQSGGWSWSNVNYDPLGANNTSTSGPVWAGGNWRKDATGLCPGGGGGGDNFGGASGAVRIIWGEGRCFPNTCVLDY